MIEILDLCLKHGVAFGTTPSGPKAGADWIKRGCRFFALDGEQGMISAGVAEAVATYH